jgi:hypothetical protein
VGSRNVLEDGMLFERSMAAEKIKTALAERRMPVLSRGARYSQIRSIFQRMFPLHDHRPAS